MKARSAKTEARDRWYAALRPVYLGGPGLAQVRECAGVDAPGWPVRECRGLASEVHHAMGRTPLVVLNVATWRPLCSPCHYWATDHPEDARRSGLSLHRNGPVPELDRPLVQCRACGEWILWALDEGVRSVPLQLEKTGPSRRRIAPWQRGPKFMEIGWAGATEVVRAVQAVDRGDEWHYPDAQFAQSHLPLCAGRRR